MTYSELEYERNVVFRNPTSSRAHHADHQDFFDTFVEQQGIPDEHIFPTSADWHETQALLTETLRPGDLVTIFGGDGTYNDHIQAQCDDDTPELVRQTPVLLMGGGNGNDAARAFNKSTYRHSAARLLDQAKVIEFNPIRCQVELAGEVDIYYAASYLGFNATGTAAAEIDARTHRERPERKYASDNELLLIDGQAILRALWRCHEFKVDNGTEIRAYFERTFGNGPYMSKVGHLPVSYSEDRLYEVDIREKRLAAIIPAIGAMIVPTRLIKPAGQYFSEPVSFSVLDDVAWQRDGSPDQLVAGSQVTVSRATNRRLHVVSTRKTATIP
jgi:hypothetical protein